MAEEDNIEIKIGGRLAENEEAAELIMTSFPVADRLGMFVVLGKHISKSAEAHIKALPLYAATQSFQLPEPQQHEADESMAVFSFDTPKKMVALRTLLKNAVIALENLPPEAFKAYPGADNESDAKIMVGHDVQMAKTIIEIASELLEGHASKKSPEAHRYDTN